MTADEPARREPARTLELLWGLTSAPSRGPKPALSVSKIVEKAVEIADNEGLAAVSMRRIAEDLGFTTMSLYRYVPSKEDLLELMQDAAASPVPDPSEIPEGWREGMAWWANYNIEFFRRHPWFLEIPLSRPPMGPYQVRWMELGLRRLMDTGLTPIEMMGVLQLISTYALSAGRLEQYLTQAASRTGVQPQEWDVVYGQLLAKVVDPEDNPALAYVFGLGGDAASGESADDVHADAADGDDIAFGLDVILDGVEALIERRRAQRDSG